jgi:LPXTG-motif cell wall-anchored protein
VKKLILALTAVAFIGLGAAPTYAQDATVPAECIDKPSSDPADPCYNPVLYPPTTPDPSVPTTTVSKVIPTTGSSVSPILGLGALLVVGGGLIVVAARRRSTSSNPAT